MIFFRYGSNNFAITTQRGGRFLFAANIFVSEAPVAHVAPVAPAESLRITVHGVIMGVEPCYPAMLE